MALGWRAMSCDVITTLTVHLATSITMISRRLAQPRSHAATIFGGRRRRRRQ